MKLPFIMAIYFQGGSTLQVPPIIRNLASSWCVSLDQVSSTDFFVILRSVVISNHPAGDTGFMRFRAPHGYAS